MIINFPKKGSTLNFLNSEEYVPIKKVRQKRSIGTFFLLEGVNR